MNVVEFDFEERVCAFIAGNYAIAPDKSMYKSVKLFIIIYLFTYFSIFLIL